MNIPKDPVILLSYVNTKLRDDFRDLKTLCQELGIGQEHIETVLQKIGYSYDRSVNQFK